jgi:long-chain acyl-CoA synthetase
LTLGQRLSKTAKEYPGNVAIVFGGKKYIYRELDEKAEAFAAGLGSLGIGRGDKVALLLSNSPEFIIAQFGASKAGCCVVPINTFLATPEIAHVLRDSGAKALITSGSFSNRYKNLPQIDSLKHLILTEGEAPGALSFDSLLIYGKTGPDAESDEQPALILYTSGTTGSPKGAVLSHRNLLANAESSKAHFQVTKKDRFLLFLPMFHTFTFLVCILLPICVGARIIVLTSVMPFSNVLKAVVLDRVTFLVSIPTVYNLLAQKKIPRIAFKFLSLRLCLSGAAPLSKSTYDRFLANYPVPLLEGYGLTEASPVVCVNPLDGVRKQGSVGLPIPNVDVKIVDEHGRERATGEVGELATRGPNVMQGYYNNPDATAETIKDGWLYTGDLGYMDEEGYIFIVDRKKDLILSHGMNIYPREIEEVLYQHPAVRQAAVIGIMDEHHGEMPKAFISTHPGATVTELQLKKFMRERLATYKVPRKIEFLENLPTNATGKLLKRELKDRETAPVA